MEIKNFRKINHHTLKASFDISFSSGIVKDFKLIHANNKKFISYPNSAIIKDGEKIFKKYYYPPEGKEEEFQKKCLELLNEFLN